METTENTLKRIGQEQILRYWGELNESEKKSLEAQVRGTDWSVLENLAHPENLSGKGKIEPISGLRAKEIEARREEFFALGKEAIKKGKVSAVLLAGGQGTRLGTDAPKGTFDIGITRPLYIFQQQIENLLEVTNECGAYVPLYVMTSEKNNDETVAFWKEKNYFGYPAQYVRFFKQDMAPAVDFSGKVILEGKANIALSPNGNGGWYSSLARCGLLSEIRARGIEWLNAFAVDNVLQRIADPVFVGACIAEGVNCGSKVVCKAEPHEKVGVLCLEDGKPNIIEYYELTEEMANARDEKGDLQYIYGVILNYLFRLEKLDEVADAKIPVHVVKKKVPYLSEAGELVKPQTENGYKFETLILDMIKLMETCLPFEVVREREFAPIKNRTGVDSVETARELLQKNGIVL
ncbi:UDPGP type 1 family protein [Candidatus Borkfalkia ceftriaxoniphila]|uniref:UDPGP type 1 family protein n=1 Tax=Candidatus Borkfalkia ceftriaxoniphila TaxID=2508949 RepID=A0A4Q2KE11_9FIRM|nr:UDPGP type 1 family protein [Candidatus Borkfalkia ceftriaxoniphila]RXZ62150.1 UDPGP type 1 family protein [Candidatus Borkfalkia ceftriaxoniphila]